MSSIRKPTVLFLIGGSLYILIETIWRAVTSGKTTHWSMFIVGGISFVLVGMINEYIPWDTKMLIQSFAGMVVILTVEFASGYILNIWLGLGIWDYSQLPGNICGQICPQFALAWYVLAGCAIVLDDYLRYWLFGEEKPHYALT